MGLLLPSLVKAQEAEQPKKGVFSSREEYGEFFKKLREANDPELNKLIPVINDVALVTHGLKKPAFGTPFNSTRSWMIKFLENQKIRKEIDMVDYQYDDLKNSGKLIYQQMVEQIRIVLAEQAVGDIDPKSLVRDISEIRAQAEGELDKVLMPEQTRRLHQIVIQSWLKRDKIVNVVTSEQVAKELGVSETQKSELRKEWKAIEQKMNEEIEAIKAKARKEFVGKLDRNQQRKFNDLVGEDFDFRPPGKKNQKKEADQKN